MKERSTGSPGDSGVTMHLPAVRDGPETIERQRNAFLAGPMGDILDDMPMFMMVTNARRQIVWMNQKARDAIAEEGFVGMRPGEAVGCIHAHEMPGGCGTSIFCSFCGASPAIMKALSGSIDTEECTIQQDDDHGGDSMDLLVWTKPLDIDGERMVLLAAYDQSEQKRHEVLERVFYHDIGNTVGGIRALLDLIEDEDSQIVDYMGLLKSAADQLIEEIDSQRALKAAEEGVLSTVMKSVSIDSLIERAIALFEYPLFGRDIQIVFERPNEGAGETECVTDPILLRRVVINMIKNALEASGRGDTIRIGLDDEPERITIWTWNAAAMSRESRIRVFQRSYSTKGRGRGLGTYGMKLLVERYLDGSVSFDSEPEHGTTFRVSIPKAAEAQSSEP